ncbi:patatin-like phospholipase family protein [Peptoniphilus stercorisuis]|uniref:NTE family protein n=1 Tax=Peptoniphilus stercorisuis TaxID=1436965 RepID=A0ABS4KDZ1_9FIRM|nr:patatin-like phospholipase family protein [Peptoniphilus stercorisuis]MBP2025620.1 NTE family protein [Peptoniphilus stercorisuis]
MYGLVLEGGGAKGAYQIGSYFALRELGFEFEAVVGTSIGALNGALIAMGEPEKCAKMWKTLSFENFPTKETGEESIDNFDELKNFPIKEPVDIMELLKQKATGFIKQRQISSEPLKQLVEEYIDEDKIRNSNMNYGLVTLNVSDKIGEELYLKDVPYGKLKNYIVASAYFPLFQLEPIDGKYYLDGGLYDNIPYTMIQRLNLTPVIVRTNPNDLIDKFPENAIVIAPKEKYTSAMDFNPVKSEEIMRIGYFDTYKKINGLFGDKYYIEKFDEDEAFKAIEDLFFEKIEVVDLSGFKNNSKYRVLFEEIIPTVASELGLISKFTYVDFLVAFLEREANDIKLDYLKIYSLEELVEDIKNHNIRLDEKTIKGKKLNELVRKILDKNENK